MVYLGVPLVACGVWWLVLKGSYRRVEKVFLAMTLAFLTSIPAAFLARPDWGQVLHQAVIPPQLFPLRGFSRHLCGDRGHHDHPLHAVYIQSAVAEKGIQPKDYAYEVVDVYSSSLFGNLISCFIIIAIGATLFVHHVVISDAANGARALEPIAGPSARELFAIGLFGASMLAAAVLPLSTAYALCEAFGFERGFKEALVFQGLFTGLIALGALVALIPGLPSIPILINLQVLDALLLPVLLVFIVRLVNDRRLMGRYTSGRVYNLIAWATTVVIGALALAYLLLTWVVPLFGVQVGG